MPIKSSMGANRLQVRRGDINNLPYFNGILNPAIMADPLWISAVKAGRVYSVTTGGFLVPGILAAAGAAGAPQPYFGVSGLDSNNFPDTQRTRYNGNAEDRGMGGYLNKTQNVGSAPGFYGIPTQSTEVMGGFATIAWNAAAELSTTGFVTGSSYPVGTALSAVSASAAVVANRGLLRPVSAATDVIVGYVSAAGKFVGPDGYDYLSFTPAFVAGTTVPAAV